MTHLWQRLTRESEDPIFCSERTHAELLRDLPATMAMRLCIAPNAADGAILTAWRPRDSMPTALLTRASYL